MPFLLLDVVCEHGKPHGEILQQQAACEGSTPDARRGYGPCPVPCSQASPRLT